VTAKKSERKPAKLNGSSSKQPTAKTPALVASESITNRSGPVFRRWRESKPNPLTREDLAMRMGCCMSTIRNWEDGKGTREPRVSQLIKLERIKPGLIVKLFRPVLHSLAS
jgi:ribosome-binding protein aMBF1 (putative translation factor)